MTKTKYRATAALVAAVGAFSLSVAPAAATDYGASYAPRVNPDEYRWADRATVARVFEGDRLGVWSDYPALERAYDDGIRKFSISWKGSSGQDVRDFAATIPEDAKVFGTYWHEPENDVEKGRITLADWKANTIRLARVMRNNGIVPVRILMAWTLFPEAGRDVTKYDLPKGTVTISAFDAHVLNKDPARTAKLLLREKARTRLPLAVPETTGTASGIESLKRNLNEKARWACYFTAKGMSESVADEWFS